MRFNEEQMTRGMMNFEHSIRCVNDKLCKVIEVTNKNSNVLKTLAYKSIDLEARSRRNNLIFWGLPELYNENCFFVIRDFIKRHLDLDVDNMYLSHAHRLGPRKIGQRDPKRPIIVNFRDYCDTDILIIAYLFTLCSNSDLYICLCYVIPNESSRQALTETNIFDRLLDSVVFVENKAESNFHLLVCGDFNSRPSDNPDFVSNDESTHYMNTRPMAICIGILRMSVTLTITAYYYWNFVNKLA